MSAPEKKTVERWCAVPSCDYNSEKGGYSFFAFPKQRDRLLQWINLCNRTDLLKKDLSKIWKSTFICGQHFENKMFLNDLRNRLQPHAVPTIFGNERATVSEEAGTSRDISPSLQQGNVPSKDEIKIAEPPAVYEPPKKIRILQDIRLHCPEDQITDTPANLPVVDINTSGTSAVEEEHPKYLEDIQPSVSSVGLQTQKHLSATSPRKQKLRRALILQRRKILKLEKTPHTSDTVNLDQFLNLCNKFLTPELAAIVKFNAEMKNATIAHYTPEYKQFALSIYFLGPKVYKYLSKIIRLPSVRTLRRMTQHWNISEGVCNFVYSSLQLKTSQFTDEARQCILCIDEISIKANLFYNITKDEIIGFHKSASPKYQPATHAMVLFAKGIYVNWKQPVGYVLTHSTCTGAELEEVLTQTVRELSRICLYVRAIVSDAGSNFCKFAKEHGVTPNTPYCSLANQKLFYIFDTPHLIKATRNIFFKYVLKFGNYTADKKYLEEFYKKDKESFIRSAPKLTDSHMSPSNFERMKVKLAVQVFSQSVAAALSTYVSLGALPGSAFGTIRFIEKMDKLFDLLNSSNPKCSKKYNKIFKGEGYQIEHLEEMTELFKNIQIYDNQGKNRTRSVRNFSCWQVTINGIKLLWEELNKPSLYTRRLQQDSLENFFGAIRQQCGNARNPTPVQFKRAFKKLFCMKYFVYTEGANCAEDFEIVLNELKNTTPSHSKELFQSVVENMPDNIDTRDYKSLDLPQQNALVYVCGYLLKKCHSCVILKRVRMKTFMVI